MEKRGLLAALQAEGLRRGEKVLFADEMPLGLLRQVRRVWRRRGEKLIRRVEFRYEWVHWCYTILAQTFFLGGTSPKCPSHTNLMQRVSEWESVVILWGGQPAGLAAAKTLLHSEGF
jgi:hypothetical protein